MKWGFLLIMNKTDFCLNKKEISLEIFTQNNVKAILKTNLKIPENLLIILKGTWNFTSAKKKKILVLIYFSQ